MEACDHVEGSPVGQCAICDQMVCSECFQTVFSEVICSAHEKLEDEDEWVLVGFYSDREGLNERRYTLADHSIPSVIAEVDEETIELYVPNGDKEEAFALLDTQAEYTVLCVECRIEFTKNVGDCPSCGVSRVQDAAESAGD